MQTLSERIHTIRLAVESFHPAAPAVCMLALVFLSQYLVRRFIPGVWEWMANLPFGTAQKPAVMMLRKAWQALPSAAVGAFLGAVAYDGDTTAAVAGAIVALFAPVGHEILKAAPIPYRGSKKNTGDKK